MCLSGFSVGVILRLSGAGFSLSLGSFKMTSSVSLLVIQDVYSKFIFLFQSVSLVCVFLGLCPFYLSYLTY